jgi:hypothetical protein
MRVAVLTRVTLLVASSMLSTSSWTQQEKAGRSHSLSYLLASALDDPTNIVLPIRKLALVVGNSTYQSVQPQLANPANDADLIANTLKALGFTLIGDKAQDNLTLTQLRSALQQFSSQAASADVGVFYYAGHGIQAGGINYLVPSDANPINGLSDVPTQMVDASTVLETLDKANIRLKIMILDACRNNPFVSRGLQPTRGLADMSRGFTAMRAPRGTVIWYATQPGNVASDGVGSNGPFALAISHNISVPGQDIYGVFNKTGLEVLNVTQNNQQPWLAATPLDGDFYFVQNNRSLFQPVNADLTPEKRIRMFSAGIRTPTRDFAWGQTYAEVNKLLDSHFSITSYDVLPRAAEYGSTDVRYFWVPLTGLPVVLSALVPPSLLDGHCIDPESYITFFFEEQKLFHIAIRLYRGGNCSSYGWLVESLFSGQHRSARIHSTTGDTAVISREDSNYSYIEITEGDPATVWTD